MHLWSMNWLVFVCDYPGQETIRKTFQSQHPREGRPLSKSCFEHWGKYDEQQRSKSQLLFKSLPHVPQGYQWELRKWCSLCHFEMYLEVQPGMGTDLSTTNRLWCLLDQPLCEWVYEGCVGWELKPYIAPYSLSTRECQRTPWSWTCRLCAVGTCRGQLAASQVL